MNRRTLIIAGFATLALTACAAQNTENEMPQDTGVIAPGTNRDFSFTLPTHAPDDIWALWTDPNSWGLWDLGLKSASMEMPMALGSTGEIIPWSGSASPFVVVSFDPKKSYAFETKLPGSVLRVERSFNEARTEFTHHVTFSGLTAGIFARMFGPDFRRALPPTMEKLKSLSENR